MFTLPPLPYSEHALAPVISAKTIAVHYGKHHQAYLDNLNKLLSGSGFEEKTLEEIILNATGGIFNNAAQVWNHTFYWNCLKPSGSKSKNEVIKAIEKDFSSFEQFIEDFSRAALTLFGSGWAWLVKDKTGKLSIVQESNAGNPMTQGLTPLLTCDVWEHAYYLDKQNRRADYIKEFWTIVNWNFVNEQYLK